MTHRRLKTLLRSAAVLFIACLCLSAEFDPAEAFEKLLTWQKPDPYPPPMLEGMDTSTLSIMLDSGNLQWYEPRPEPDKWEGVVGLKVHAPPSTVWDVMVDYELQCKIMADTFDSCRTADRSGNLVRNVYRIHTSVVMYSYEMDMVDMVREDPPHHLHITTVGGELTGRELDILLIPDAGGEATLLFVRYYASLSGMGPSMSLVISAMPQVEPPTSVSAANYHARSYRIEAERRAGYKRPPKPGDLEIEKLDLATLRRIDRMNGGLIRETPEGKFIDALSFAFIAAPVERVWEVATDFQNFDEIFKGSETEVLSREGNTVELHQRTSAFKILFFDFGQELYSRYRLEPPRHLSYRSVRGVHEGTYGDLRLLPIEDGKATLAFAVAGINLEKDTGLVARISQSGAFPMEIMLNMLTTQYTLACIKEEAELRENTGSAKGTGPGQP